MTLSTLMFQLHQPPVDPNGPYPLPLTERKVYIELNPSDRLISTLLISHNHELDNSIDNGKETRNHIRVDISADLVSLHTRIHDLYKGAGIYHSVWPF